MLYALVALCLFGGASAQLFALWSCPEAVKPMSNFNISRPVNAVPQRSDLERGRAGRDGQKLHGRWYKVKKYPLMITALSYCPWVTYDFVPPGTLKVQHGAFYARQTIQIKLRGEVYAKDASQPGQLSARMVTDKYVRDYWVLDTDYDSFLVIYSCRNFFVFHLKYLLIFTKEPIPSSGTLSKAEDALDRNKLRTTQLQTIDRGGCKEVDTL